MSARVWGAARPLLATGCGLVFAAGLVVGVILSPWVVSSRTRDAGSDPPATVTEGKVATGSSMPCDCGPAEAAALAREDLSHPASGPGARGAGANAEPETPATAAGEDIVLAPPPPEREVELAVGESEAVDPLAALVARGLSVPVLGVRREDLRDSYAELRGGSRRHEAIDILAPRDTPVVAVEDGTIAKLFTSHGGGGLTIYQFDENEQFAYYYAHLERYASGLAEGARVRRGQVIGFVGTSGNAPPDTPHLHFAVYRLSEERRWWEGDPFNPYEILRPGQEPPGSEPSP
jgi:murein DD-endopeptidase MepM/ murein hydrolase activator NlpD